MELREIAPHVYAFLVEDRGWAWSNAGFVASGGGLMVDTLADVRRTRHALELYAAHTGAPPRRLVNTHHNLDHCWGNQLFRDAEILGHRACAKRMRQDLTPATVQALLAQPDPSPGVRWLAESLSAFDFSEVEVTPPNRLLDGDHVLELDGTRVEILYLGPAHTEGDVVVHLPETGVVFAGDLVFRRCTPIGWEGTFAGWIAALEHIAALEPAVIVPGHGPLSGPEGALELRDYLVTVREEAARHYGEGVRDVLEASKRIDPGPWTGWTQPERLVFNVARAFRELRGGPIDEPVPVLELLDAAVELRRHWEATGHQGRRVGARNE